MYWPLYKITPFIAKQIAIISAAREAIMNSPLLPKIESRLKRDALISRSHHSTSIEGNPLSREQVEAIVSGKKIEAQTKDKKEVLNYISALKFIDKYGRNIKKFTPAIILKLHQLIVKDVLPEDRTGKFRNQMVYVVDNFGRTVFTPPSAKKVPDLIKDLCNWLNSNSVKELYPVLIAGITHYELVRIHPFVDGNGRTSRALATLILYQSGFDIKDFFALDDYYNENRALYYAALQAVDPKIIDITQWLEYFTEGVAKQIGKIKEKIKLLSRDRLLIKKQGQIWLNEKQWKIMELLQKYGKITNRELQATFNISAQAVHKELSKLVNLKLIRAKGKGRSLYYISLIK